MLWTGKSIPGISSINVELAMQVSMWYLSHFIHLSNVWLFPSCLNPLLPSPLIPFLLFLIPLWRCLSHQVPTPSLLFSLPHYASFAFRLSSFPCRCTARVFGSTECCWPTNSPAEEEIVCRAQGRRPNDLNQWGCCPGSKHAEAGY